MGRGWTSSGLLAVPGVGEDWSKAPQTPCLMEAAPTPLAGEQGGEWQQ